MIVEITAGSAKFDRAGLAPFMSGSLIGRKQRADQNKAHQAKN
jgi:hypothetical protein